MVSWNLSRRLPAAILFLSRAVKAGIPSDCAYPGGFSTACSKPIANITEVTPGRFIAAKLQCYGCPTVERLERGSGHIIIHEENALFFNISLSSTRTALFVNSAQVLPSLPYPPPRINAGQVPLNFSLASLASTIDCTHQPCRNFNGRCNCLPDRLGVMSLSYDYVMLPSPQTDDLTYVWTVLLDALGGDNGYMLDPYASFDSPEQRVLSIDIQEDKQEGTLNILDAKLIERAWQPGSDQDPSRPHPVSAWKKVLQFVGLETDHRGDPGHIVYLSHEWNAYGRVGTFKNLILRLWGELPWGLYAIICGSVLGGLLMLYLIWKLVVAVYRAAPERGAGDEEDNLTEGEKLAYLIWKLIVTVYKSPRKTGSRSGENKWNEGERLLNDDDEDTP